MRCFAAIDVPDEIKRSIIALQEKMPKNGLRIVSKENTHFTLQFYGDQPEKDIKFIESRLSETASRFQPFDAHLKGLGAFPSQSYIKVVWIGCPALYDLMKSVQDALSEKFHPEKNITPHLTLARVGTGADYDYLRDFVKQHEAYEGGYMNVREIKLKQSILTPQGPVYTDINIFRLSA